MANPSAYDQVIPSDHRRQHTPTIFGELAEVISSHILYKIRIAFANGYCSHFTEGARKIQGEMADIMPNVKEYDAASEQIVIVDCEADHIPGEEVGQIRGVLTLGVSTAVFPAPLEIPLVMAVGTYLSTFSYIAYYELLNLSFPAGAEIDKFHGPKFGSAFLAGELPLGALLKPRYSDDRSYLREWIASADAAGLDYISDDELTVGTSSLGFNTRVSVVTEVLRKRDSRITYIPNVTGNLDQTLNRCEIARDSGIKAVLLNIHTMGYDAVAAVSEAYPELACVSCALGVGTIARGPRFGVSLSLIGRLARMAGSDAFYTGVFGGMVSTARDTPASFHRALCGTVSSNGRQLEQTTAVLAGGIGFPELIRAHLVYRGPFIAPFGYTYSRARSEGVDLAKYVGAVREGFEVYSSGGGDSLRSWAQNAGLKKYSRAILERLRLDEAVSIIDGNTN